MPGRTTSSHLFNELKQGVTEHRGSGTRPRHASGVPEWGGEVNSPSLTEREWTVLRLLVDGLRNQEISAELGISERTVKFHVKSLFSKLGVTSRTQVVSQALQQGLLEH